MSVNFIEGMTRAAGYTFQGIFNKQFWDGTIDYIKIIPEGQKTNLGSNKGADLHIMHDGIEKVELLENSYRVTQDNAVYYYIGWSWDLCFIRERN